MPRIFFATDIHGSQICWKKFIGAAPYYKADFLVLGGDMTGKALIPLVSEPNGTFSTHFQDNDLVVKNQDEAMKFEKMVSDKGYYPIRIDRTTMDEMQTNREKLASWSNTSFNNLMMERVKIWMSYADEKLKGSVNCFVCPGNDDMFEIDALIAESKKVKDIEGKVVQINGGYEILGSGWSTPTPWKTFRECSEEDLLNKITKMTDQLRDPSRSIFDLHDPPVSSGLDEAPDLSKELNLKYGGKVTKAVGSSAVRQAIEKTQPLVGLHGHIHESKGIAKIGRTVCINPGSIYEEGTLMGAVVDFEGNKLKNYYVIAG